VAKTKKGKDEGKETMKVSPAKEQYLTGKDLSTLPGGVSQKDKLKKKAAGRRRRDEYNKKRMQKDILDPTTVLKGPAPIVNPKKPFEEKGKAKGIPRLPEETPEEVISMLKEVAEAIPDVPDGIPDCPVTDDVEEFVEQHTDLEWTDELHLKFISKRTGHMMPSNGLQGAKVYLTGQRYKFKYAEGLKYLEDQEINLEEDWQPFIIKHRYNDKMLLSVLRGKSIAKNISSIKIELQSWRFQNALKQYLEGYEADLTREYKKIINLREKLLSERELMNANANASASKDEEVIET